MPRALGAETSSRQRKQGLQEWWRGVNQMRQLKKELRFRFDRDVLGIDGTRFLVLLDRDEEALGIWSRAVLAAGSGE